MPSLTIPTAYLELGGMTKVEVARDDFNRADTVAPFFAGVGLGPGWTAPGWKILSNQAKKEVSTDDTIFLSDIGSFDHWVEMRVAGTDGVQNPVYTVVHARVNETSGLAQNAVIGYIDPGESKRSTLARYQGGGFAEIAFGTNGIDISGTYWLRLECVGDEARLYHNSVLVVSANISTLENLGTYGGMAAQNASPPIDDFRVGIWEPTAPIIVQSFPIPTAEFQLTGVAPTISVVGTTEIPIPTAYFQLKAIPPRFGVVDRADMAFTSAAPSVSFTAEVPSLDMTAS